MSWRTHLARSYAFGRHIRASQLLRRWHLITRRIISDRLGWYRHSLPLPRLNLHPPLPLLPPRASQCTRNNQGLRFVFLGRVHQMQGPIDWRAPGEGATLQLWRMNLHYMEYLEALDDALCLDLINQWVRANPLARGAWQDSWNAYALSLRVVVWMQQLAMRPGLAGQKAILASLAAQIGFLATNLETDVGGNHLIKNIKALVWASAFFAGPQAAQWQARALSLLGRELRRQILADGMHYERSPSYHVQVFADLLECAQVLGKGALWGQLDDVLARMAQVTADMTHSDGCVALFNDAGMHMAYPPAQCLDVYEALFGARPSPRAVFALEQAGYFGLRKASSLFIADCGRIAPDDLPAHGHGDILSFEWSLHGQRIIVDPGVYEYIAGPKRVRARAASAHNTVCFEGADQAEFFGAFRVGRRPDVTVLTLEASATRLVLEGTHTGFAHLPGQPSHIRRFEVCDRNLVIRDQLLGAQKLASAIHFLFHPDINLAQAGDDLIITGQDMLIRMTSTLPIRIADSEWWPDMGVAIPTRSASVAVESAVATVITTFNFG